MNYYFKRISDIIKNKKVSIRICKILQDLMELRENRWVPRGEQCDQQLKTTYQVREINKRESRQTSYNSIWIILSLTLIFCSRMSA